MMEQFSEISKLEIPGEVTEHLNKASDYFHSHPGFRRLFEGLVEKYRSLGRLGGNIVLEDVTNEERTTLEAFFRQRLPGVSLRFSASQFVRALAETRFGNLNPLDLLTVWSGNGLVTRQEQREHDECTRQRVLKQYLKKYQEPQCQLWLNAILEKDPDLAQAQRALVNDRNFDGNMTIVLSAFGNLPDDYQRLPVFARNICGNPHGLDKGSAAGKLFLEGLRYIRRHSQINGNEDYPVANVFSVTEELNELLYHFKLLRDDLLNFATCFGFAAYDDEKEIAYWRMASETGAPLNVPLREIARVTTFRPYNESNQILSVNHQYDVFVVENSGVFSALIDECVSSNIRLVCLHGQFKLASWALLDRLTQSGAVLHYSGDFDPEGLQMAQKLYMRYPDRVHFWRMTVDDYFQSTPSAFLDETRIQKFNSMKTPELALLAGVIAEKKLAGYQEGILDLLAKDLKCFSGN
ncbi:MAG TPA: TIGR02679 family protein [Bacillota bacterium]|nr:TIGR02679 family protein [Bacillota bacterium]